MGDQIVRVAPDDPDGRPIHLVGKDHVLRLGVMRAQLLHLQLGKALAAVTRAQPAVPPSHQGYRTEAQNRHLHALFGELGIAGDDRHEALARILGREVPTTKELTVAEAATAIDRLQREVAKGQPAEHEEAF
jgi:hypothetical protein